MLLHICSLWCLVNLACLWDEQEVCEGWYYTNIGETGRRFGTRLSEHQKETKRVESSNQNYTRASRKQSQSELFKSAIADHAVQYNHVINWDSAKILGKECNTSIRRICESMWIRRRGPQAMNRDEGAHFLSHVFDPFLTGSTPSTAGVRPTGKTEDR